jgi:hypothetical protein
MVNQGNINIQIDYDLFYIYGTFNLYQKFINQSYEIIKKIEGEVEYIEGCSNISNISDSCINDTDYLRNVITQTTHTPKKK